MSTNICSANYFHNYYLIGKDIKYKYLYECGCICVFSMKHTQQSYAYDIVTHVRDVVMIKSLLYCVRCYEYLCI